VRNDDARGTSVKCRGKADLVVLGHADDDVRLALGVVLSGLDGAVCGGVIVLSVHTVGR